MENNQRQKAGDNSQQIQADVIVVNQGIDEKRAREIYMEMFNNARREFSEESLETIQERIIEFENDLIPKMEKIDGALQSFADPCFQKLLQDAHKTAAITDNKDDYAVLSELLIRKIKKGNNRDATIGIRQAIEIVNEIPDKALLGLTVEYAWSIITPTTGIISKGLDVLDNLFSKIISDNLPQGNEWMEQLDILNAIRITDFSNFKKMEDYYLEQLDGYFSVGIEKDSENYYKALDILKQNNTASLLIEHEINEGFYRLAIPNKNQLKNTEINIFDTRENKIIKRKINDKEKESLEQVLQLYNGTEELKNKIKNNLVNEISKRENLTKVKKWIESIPKSFTITPIGKALANANAQRIYPEFPPLD